MRRGAPTLRKHTALAYAVVLAVGACSSSDGGFDREAAVTAAMGGGAGLERSAAECYVDRVADELGSEVLDSDAPRNDGLEATMVAIRVDCVGISEVGRPGTGSQPPSGVGEPAEGGGQGRPPGPWTFGADEELDELWTGCERGSGAACDELFDRAPLGSDYETFGATCGNRGAEPVCAPLYPG